MKLRMKLRMLTIRELSSAAKETVCRFPLLTLFLCVGAANRLYMNIYKVKAFEYASRNIFMTLLLLLPVLFSIQLFHEAGWIGKRMRFVACAISLIGAALYLYVQPLRPLISFDSVLFGVLLAASVLLCFSCVKRGLNDDRDYWLFYVTLFVRLAVTFLFVLIIIGGATGAFAAIDGLFKTSLYEKIQLKVVIVTLWILGPIFFLSGVPDPSRSTWPEEFRPGWLKSIGVYVLIPLTVAYLGILYAYGGKILVQWQLPNGMVSWLVLSFAVFGIVSLLIIFPFQKDENTRWCYWFSRSFYVLQIPLLLLLFVAIFTRVFTYGITIRRYYVFALAIWLFFLTVFMVVRRNRNLVAIPSSLLVIAVLSLVGPWSSFNVSFISQKARLLGLLNGYHLIEKGRLVPSKEFVPFRARSDISSIARYLDDYGTLQRLAHMTGSEKILGPESFVREMGIEYVESYQREHGRSFYYYSTVNRVGIPLSRYELLVKYRKNVGVHNWENGTGPLRAGGMTVEFLPVTGTFTFTDQNSRTATIDLKQAVRYFGAQKRRGGDNHNYTYLYEDRSFEIYCLFQSLSGREAGDGMQFDALDVDFLVRRK